jgi:hypothetical protein
LFVKGYFSISTHVRFGASVLSFPAKQAESDGFIPLILRVSRN